MATLHVYTSPVPDDPQTSIVRPSDWNSAHFLSQEFSGNTVNSSVITGMDMVWAASGIATLSVTSNTVVINVPSGGGGGDGGNVISAGTRLATTLGTVLFANANGISFGLDAPNGTQLTASYTVPSTAGLLSAVNLSAGTTSQNLSAFQFNNANGLSFGLNGSTITASHNGLTSQSNQAFSAPNASSAFQTLVFNDANGFSWSNNAGSVEGRYSVPSTAGLLSAVNVSAGTTSNNLSALTFNNANGISFGLNASTITASHNALTSQSNQAFSAQGGSSTFQTLSFNNANGFTFSNVGGAVQGSYTVPSFVQSNQTLGIYASSNTTGQSSSSTYDARSLTIVGAGVASVGWSNSSLVVSVPSGGGAGDGGNTLVAGGQTATTNGLVEFADSNGISFGLNAAGGTRITATYTVPSTAGLLSAVNLSAGTTSNNLSAFVFSNSNNVSFGLNGSTVTATATFPAQTNQTIGGYFVGNTTGQSSSSTVDARSISVDGAGIVSAGWSNGSIRISATQSNQAFSAAGGSSTFQTLSFNNANGLTFSNVGGAVQGSYTVPTQTVQTLGIYVTAQSTGQSSSSTYDARSLSFVPDGIISAGWSNGSFRVSATQSNQAFSAAGGSSAFQTLSFNNANGLTFSNVGGAVQGSYTVPTVTNSSWTVSDNGTSGTVARLAFTNLNGVTLSLSTGAGGSHTIVGSHNALTSQSNQAFSAAGGSSAFQTLGFSDNAHLSWTNTNGSVAAGAIRGSFYAVSNTTQSSSMTAPISALSFHGAGIASVGASNGSIIVSVPSGGGAGDGGVFAGVSTAGNTAGSTGTVSTGNFVLVGSGPISLSQSTGAAGSAATVSIIGPAVSSLSATGAVSISTNGSTISIGVGTVTASATGNTTQASSGTLNLTGLVIQGTGGASVGISNGSLVISGAAGGGGGGLTATMWWPFNEGVNVAGQRGNASWAIAPIPTPPTAAGGEVQIDRVLFPLQVTYATNSTGSATISMSLGLYTKNGASLSLAYSTTGTLPITYSGTANSSLVSGIRLMSIPWTTTLGDGRYYVAVASRTTTGGANCTISQQLVSQLNSNFSGFFMVASNRSQQWPLGLGVYSASSTAFPNPIAFSQIDGTASLAARPPSWFMLSGTV